MNLGSAKNPLVFLSPELVRTVLSYFTIHEINDFIKNDGVLTGNAKIYLEQKQEHKRKNEEASATSNQLLEQYHERNQLPLFKELLSHVPVCQKFNSSFHDNSCNFPKKERHWIFTAKTEFIYALLESPAAEQAVMVDTSQSPQNKQQEHYLNFLHFAFHRQFNTVISFLLKSMQGPNLVTQRDSSGNCVLHLIVNHRKGLEFLLDGFNWLINQRNAQGETALYLSASQGYHESFELLLQRNADVTLATTKGSTPGNDTVFHAAFRLEPSDEAEIIQAHLIAFLKTNPTVKAMMLNCVNSHGDTPLIVAFNKGCSDGMFLELFGLGAVLNYNIPHFGGLSRLVVALKNYEREIYEFDLIELIISQKDVKLTPQEKTSVQKTIILAAEKCDFDFLDLLLRECSGILTKPTLTTIQASLEKFKEPNKENDRLEKTLRTIKRMQTRDQLPPGYKPLVTTAVAQGAISQLPSHNPTKLPTPYC